MNVSLGTFVSSVRPYLFGTTIDEEQVNAEFDDIDRGLSNCITRDGQSTVTQDIPFNSRKITSLGEGEANTHAVTVGQVQDQAYVWCGAIGGTANAGVLTPTPAILAYKVGQHFRWVSSAVANTGRMTVNISRVGEIEVQQDFETLQAGAHEANRLYAGVLDTRGTIQLIASHVVSRNIQAWAQAQNEDKIPPEKLTLATAAQALAGTSMTVLMTPVRVFEVVRSLVSNWAETGNTDPIPIEKLTGATSLITAETQTRLTDVTALGGRIDTEVIARTNADTTLGARITTLMTNADTTHTTIRQEIADILQPDAPADGLTRAQVDARVEVLVANFAEENTVIDVPANRLGNISLWAHFNNTTVIPTAKFPTATGSVRGIVELATAAESIVGTDSTRAVTPAGLKAATDALPPSGLTQTQVDARVSAGVADWAEADNNSTIPTNKLNIASSTRLGVVEFASNAETISGTSGFRAVTPKSLKAVTDALPPGGLTEAETDARVRAGVQNFAESGNNSLVPNAKLPIASTTTRGIAELATAAEARAGTDVTRAVTPQGLKSAVDAEATLRTSADTALGERIDAIPTVGTVAFVVALGNETDDVETGTAVTTFRMPYAMNLTDIRASLTTASTSGNVQIRVTADGAPILSQSITISTGHKSSVTSSPLPVLFDTTLADNQEIVVQIFTAGTGAKGAKLYLIGTVSNVLGAR